MLSSYARLEMMPQLLDAKKSACVPRVEGVFLAFAIAPKVCVDLLVLSVWRALSCRKQVRLAIAMSTSSPLSSSR